MKNLILSFLLLCIGFTSGFAQSTTCSTPMALNSGPTTSIPLDTGIVNTDITNDYGCLTVTDNPLWIYLKVCIGGDASLYFSTMGSGVDVDLVVYGPLSGPSDCGLDTSDIIVCSTGPGLPSFNLTGLNAGDYYKIFVSNVSNIPTTLNINISGSASFDTACPPPGCLLAEQEICMVTTNYGINKNVIVWNKDTTLPFTSYVIEKESTVAGVFIPLDTLSPTDTSAYTDMVSNPMVQAFRYRICVTDTCGDYFCGMPHQTMHLLTSVDMLGYPQLSWNPYVGFYYGTYFIFRGTSPSTMDIYDSLASSSTTYTDINPLPGTVYYSVGVMPPSACTPTRAMMMCNSNNAMVMLTGISEEHNTHLAAVFPNPAADLVNFRLATNSNVTLQFFEMNGKQVLNKTFNAVNSGTVDISGISEGIYILSITTGQGTERHKITVSH